MCGVREALGRNDARGDLSRCQWLLRGPEGVPDKTGEFATLEVCRSGLMPRGCHIVRVFWRQDGYGRVQIGESGAEFRYPLLCVVYLAGDLNAPFPLGCNGVVHASNVGRTVSEVLGRLRHNTGILQGKAITCQPGKCTCARTRSGLRCFAEPSASGSQWKWMIINPLLCDFGIVDPSLCQRMGLSASIDSDPGMSGRLAPGERARRFGAAEHRGTVMLRNLNVLTKYLAGCGLAFAITALSGGAHAKGAQTAHHRANHPPAASRERVLYAFQGGTDGANPAGSLIADSAGNLYGTAGFGGDSNCRVTSHRFLDHRVKENPGCGIVFRLSTAGRETILHTFSGGDDGAGPPGALYEDASGNLFGVTAAGGGKKFCRRGCGTVFEIKSGGSEKLLYAFTGGDCCSGSNDGGAPDGTLIVDSSGNFYGTTAAGGGGSDCGATGAVGCGMVFELTPDGIEIVLHTFRDARSDGVYPGGALALDKSGNLYGLTAAGGSDGDCGLGAVGCGVLFEISSGGVESILHRFTGGSDGAYPAGNPVMDGAGNIYFTTVGGGGKTDCGLGPYGCGVLFRYANGALTVLHTFKGGTDGAFPIGSPLVDTSGSVFGTTGGGGSTKNCGLGGSFGCGVVFEVSSGGKESVLHAFKGGASDGAYPMSGLLSLNNHLYGTTATGGTGCGKAGCGTVFEVRE